MVINIYASDNYVIIYDGTNTFEYAKGYTTYTLKNDIFTIKETVGGEYNVTVRDVTDGNVKDQSNVAYTVATFTTFLRKNTGFKTAAGGSAAAPIGALLQKSGQTTSYRTGDDGDIEAGRLASFNTLSANNPFSNTNRFTDELGGQTYTKNIVIDWSTYNGTNVLGYYRITSVLDVTWNSAIDLALAFSVVGFNSGWRLPNKKELENIWNGSATYGYNYSPFNLGTSLALWTSTTLIASTGFAYQLQLANYGQMDYAQKTSSANMRYLSVRNFTVTGTTLS